jgi:hypothetical protein
MLYIATLLATSEKISYGCLVLVAKCVGTAVDYIYWILRWLHSRLNCPGTTHESIGMQGLCVGFIMVSDPKSNMDPQFPKQILIHGSVTHYAPWVENPRRASRAHNGVKRKFMPSREFVDAMKPSFAFPYVNTFPFSSANLLYV